VIAGLNTHFELWSMERWQAVLNALDTSAGTMAEQLAALGI
jgi:DNA-binding transcriptional regulator/RsmH inhibitor MraZ